MDETEQNPLPPELDQSDEAQRTRVWRLDQFVALGFDLARAAIMADDSGSIWRRRAGSSPRAPARDGVTHPPVVGLRGKSVLIEEWGWAPSREHVPLPTGGDSYRRIEIFGSYKVVIRERRGR